MTENTQTASTRRQRKSPAERIAELEAKLLAEKEKQELTAAKRMEAIESRVNKLTIQKAKISLEIDRLYAEMDQLNETTQPMEFSTEEFMQDTSA